MDRGAWRRETKRAAPAMGVTVHYSLQLKLPRHARSLSAMHHCLYRMNPPPLWLRCALAVILVVNGVLAPWQMTHATNPADSKMETHAMSMAAHCHPQEASDAASRSAPLHNDCPCCDRGKCECTCLSVLALPVTFPDLRPLAPQAFAAQWPVPEPGVTPPSRLLRPPIS